MPRANRTLSLRKWPARASRQPPADLQLLCANAVVAQAGGAKVLPMSSRQLDATSYSVDLDAAGRKFTCIVDSSGSVKSVQPA
ncbi:hypothetical protein Q1M64_27380 [Sinorhizobium meliloti]|nr:hypothetical protein Q1M64_27380 [Sinorhizobium meliloti]